MIWFALALVIASATALSETYYDQISTFFSYFIMFCMAAVLVNIVFMLTSSKTVVVSNNEVRQESGKYFHGILKDNERHISFTLSDGRKVRLDEENVEFIIKPNVKPYVEKLESRYNPSNYISIFAMTDSPTYKIYVSSEETIEFKVELGDNL